MTRIGANPTKYIESISFNKMSHSKLSEEWFSGKVPINPGLGAC